MELPSPLKQYAEELNVLCRQYSVDKLYAFGSVVDGRFDEITSDVDLLVELMPLPPLEKGEALIELWSELEHLFGRKVDLLTDQPIHNPYLKQSVEQTKVLIYDRASEEILI